MPPTNSSQGRQATLFGFFGKPKDGPAPATQQQKPTPAKKQDDPRRSSSNSRQTPDTPPPSVSRSTVNSVQPSDNTVYQAPSSTKWNARTKDRSSPLQSRSNGTVAQSMGRKATSLEMTPPSSSPRPHDEDDDEDEGVVSRRPRRSAATSKRSMYAESGDEMMDVDGDSDADAYSPPRDERPAKKAKRFSRVAIDSDDEFDDDDFIVPDDDELELIESQAASKKKASAPKPAPVKNKPSAASARPSSSSSSSRLQVPAGRTSIASSSSKPTTPTEEPYEFLMNPLDEQRNPPSHPDYDKRTLYIPETTLNRLTPFEKQFWAIKRKHNDTVLFFQKGKFYELYEDDAVIAHREFGLKMTDRVRMKMAGVPESSFVTFANKFLALGYKVGRVDQCETAVGMGMRKGGTMVGKGPVTAGGDDNKIVRRELKHIYTNGTIVDADCLPDEMSSYCVSIKEVVLDTVSQSSSADKSVDKNDESLSVTPVFGICFLDAGVAEFKMRHFVDDVSRTQLETILRSMRIKEVIHEKAGLSKRTLRIIKNTVPHDCNITMLKPGVEFYDAEQTLRKLNLVFNPDLQGQERLTIDDVEAVDVSILPDAIQKVLDKPEALSALGGMLSYLTQLNLEKDVCASRNFDVFDPAVQQSSMILDAQSLTHLNVLMNEQGGMAGTLLSLVNRACTPFGKRLMKIWLLSPLSDLGLIHARQEAVEALMTDSSFREDFDVFAKSLPDIERIRPRIYAGNCKSRDFARVLKALTKIDENVQLLADRASTFATKTVESVLRSIPAVSGLAREIQGMYQDEQSFEPKSGAYEPFDQADAQVEEVERSLNKELARAATLVKLPRDRVKFKDIGTNEIFQIEVPIKTKVPIEWALVSQTQSVKRYYSPEVRQLVKQLKEGRETRVAALKDFQANLFMHFQEHGDTFLQAVKGIAELDCLVSLAKASYAMGEPSCRPKFVDSDVAMVDFEELRHPCLASASTSEFIANDISLGVPVEHEADGKTSARVTILTGGNMAGKSTTARTTATAVILAQLGCRVPASKARLSAVDRIASRMGANDQLFRNNSTFMVEMLEASRILKDCTPRSLIIMDELGRGTSTFDGQAIAYAVLHHLIGRTRSLSFFLTHYTTLAHEFDDRFGVANKHMQVLVDSARREVVFTYKLVNGIAESSYGTEVAALAGVPLEICDRATHISRDFAAATKEAEKKRLEKLGDALTVATLSDFAMLFKAGLARSSSTTKTDPVEVDEETLVFLRRQIASVMAHREQQGKTIKDEGKQPSSSFAIARRKPDKAYGRTRKRRSTDGPSDGEDTDSELHRSSLSLTSSSTTLTDNGQASQSNRKRKKIEKQLTLNLGQKLWIRCKECSLAYDRSEAESVAMHDTFHTARTHGVECGTVLRAEEAIERQWIEHAAFKSFARSLDVRSSRPLSEQQTATIRRFDLRQLFSGSGFRPAVYETILQATAQMDDALGAIGLETSETRAGMTLFVAELCGRIVGTAVVGPLPQDVRVRRVHLHVDLDTMTCNCHVQMSHSTNMHVCRCTEHVSASDHPPMALYRIYVVPALRRARLASAMLDAALRHCVYGAEASTVVTRFGGKSQSIAFCQPTNAGRRFAEAWAFDGAQLASSSSSSSSGKQRSLLIFDMSS